MASRVSAPCSAEQDREGASLDSLGLRGGRIGETVTNHRSTARSHPHGTPAHRISWLVMRAVLIEPSRGTHGDHHPHDGASSDARRSRDLRSPGWSRDPCLVGAHGGSAGDLHHIEWPYDPASTEGAHLFRAWAARCPRAPFRWTFGERSMVGYFLPEFRRSRRMFERRGVPTGRGRWPDADAMAWPAGHIEAKSQFNHGTEEEA